MMNHGKEFVQSVIFGKLMAKQKFRRKRKFWFWDRTHFTGRSFAQEEIDGIQMIHETSCPLCNSSTDFENARKIKGARLKTKQFEWWQVCFDCSLWKTIDKNLWWRRSMVIELGFDVDGPGIPDEDFQRIVRLGSFQ